MWYTLRQSFKLNPDFEEYARELMQGTAKNLVLAIGIPSLILCYLAAAISPYSLFWGIISIALAVLVTCLLTYQLLPSRFLIAQMVWHLGLVGAITLTLFVFSRPELALAYALLPLMAAIMVGWQGSVAMQGLVVGLVWWLLQSPTSPLQPGFHGLPVIVGGAVTGLIGWSATHTLFTVAQWSLNSAVRAQKIVDEAREQRLEFLQSQEELMLANRELARLNDRLKLMQQFAEEAQKAKSAFVAKISHEFRTPLNMIIGLIDTLTETPQFYGQAIPPLLLRDLEIVHRNSEHLASMINDVLALSQAEAGQLPLHREWVDLTTDIDNASMIVKPLIEKKKLNYHVSIPDSFPLVYCDRTRIRQVILNLLSNAARYTEEGEIAVDIQQLGSDIVVSVSDTGSGISQEDVEQIFEPFYQATGGLWRGRDGTGLGLSVSKQFIERHGGRIWLESQVGVGSKFSFRLPISPMMPSNSQAKGWIKEDWAFLERTSWPKLPKLTDSPRVVLCDETGLLHTLFDHFTNDIEFIDTTSLRTTIEELQCCPADIAILNAETPDILGAMIEEARLEAPNTPIVGCCLPTQERDFSDLGILDYLVKPVTPADLAEVIQSVGQPIKRVLVVDDNPDILQLIERMLRLSGDELEIDTASSGEEAIEALRICAPDLILLDIVMPGMDGWHVLERKGQIEAIRDIPVVIISAEDLGEREMTSDVLLATMGQGLSINQVLRCSLQISNLLLQPQTEPDLMPG